MTRQRTYRVKGNSQWTARFQALRFSRIINDRLMVLNGDSLHSASATGTKPAKGYFKYLISSVREIHADNIEPSPAQHINFFNGVGLGANGANNGRAAVVQLWLELGIEAGKPLYLRASRRQVIQ